MIRQFPISGHERVDKHGSGEPTRLMAAVFSPDLTKAVTSGVLDDRFNIWDLSPDRVRRHTIREPKNLGATLAITPDGRIFASASAVRFAPNGDDTTIRLWEMATGREIATIADRRSGSPLARLLRRRADARLGNERYHGAGLGRLRGLRCPRSAVSIVANAQGRAGIATWVPGNDAFGINTTW